jgi:hypothetical protein
VFVRVGTGGRTTQIIVLPPTKEPGYVSGFCVWCRKICAEKTGHPVARSA